MSEKFLTAAIEQALLGVKAGHGGPFGAVVVRDGEIISAAHNQVLLTEDPTMHAEVAAIREACRKLGRFSLHDCEIYSTCMPCPMCLGAIMWAKIPKLIYGAKAADAAKAGFDDDFMYGYIKSGFSDKERLEITCDKGDECRELFKIWKDKKDRNMY